MKLPVIQYAENKELSKSTCLGTDQCSGCKLFVKNGGRCDGCTPQHKEAMSENYKWCFKECNTCSGYGVEVPAICCRSPLKDIWMQAVAGNDWNSPVRSYQERPSVTSKSKGIFYVTAGSIGTIARKEDGYLVPPDTELVCVSLARVWTGKKFATKDMHDYLKLPRTTKLALMTMNKDDVLEQAWESELYADPHVFSKVGFSYWMPIAFSSYRADAHMQQYFQWLRTSYTIDRSRAWWMCGNYRRAGLHLDDQFDEVVAKIPQIVFNVQFLVTEDAMRKQLMDVKWFHERYPEHVAFWFVGAATPSFLAAVRKYAGKRTLYFVSGNPHHFATQGKELVLSGTGRPSKLAKSELVTKNLAVFQDMVRSYG